MNRIKELRQKQQLKLKDLSKATNLSVSSISAYEREARKPKREAISSLANFFKVPPEYLMGETDDPAGWDLWEDVTGYSKETIDEKIEVLKRSHHLIDSSDLQKSIGEAVSHLHGLGTTDGAALMTVYKGVKVLNSSTLHQFYLDPKKVSNSGLVVDSNGKANAQKVYKASKRWTDGSLFYSDMNKGVYDDINKILEQTRKELSDLFQKYDL